MLATGMLLDAEPPRITRPMGEYWIPRIPWFNVYAARGGMLVGTPQNCARMLESGGGEDATGESRTPQVDLCNQVEAGRG